jgi:hypothetical protein
MRQLITFFDELRLNGFIEGTHRRPLGVMWNDPPESAPLTVISCVLAVVPLSHPETLLGPSIYESYEHTRSDLMRTCGNENWRWAWSN